MTDRRITDRGVAGLPIQQGRAELLEEIMSISTDDQPRPTDELTARRRRWLPVAGAAAAVAAIAAVVAVPPLLDGDGGPGPSGADQEVAAAPGDGEIAVLEAEGWTLDDADSIDDSGGEIDYAAGSSDEADSFSISWRDAEAYAEYAADREEVGPAREVEALGRTATMRSYSRDDHSAMLEPKGDFFLEMRGSGMGADAFIALLGRLVAIAPGDLDSHLPESFVTDDERAAVVEEMLADIPIPDGLDTSGLADSAEVDRYQLGAEVTGLVSCEWIGRFVQARRSDDAAGMQAAVDAMSTSRDWAILDEMAEDGGWSDVIWEFSDSLAAGEVPEGYQGGIGCE